MLRIITLVLFVVFISCHKGYKMTHAENIRINGVVNSDTSFVSQYRKIVDSTFLKKIGYSNLKLEKNRPNGYLGYVMAIACNDVGVKFTDEKNKIFTFLNNGGIRSSLPMGDITMKNIFEVMPFDNKLVLLELNGIQIQELFKYISIKGGNPVFNLELEIDKKGNFKNPKIKNQNFDSRKNYWVITSDYLANGGDDCLFFKNPIQSIQTNVLIRETLTNFIFQNQPITQDFFENYKLINIYE